MRQIRCAELLRQKRSGVGVVLRHQVVTELLLPEQLPRQLAVVGVQREGFGSGVDVLVRGLNVREQLLEGLVGTDAVGGAVLDDLSVSTTLGVARLNPEEPDPDGDCADENSHQDCDQPSQADAQEGRANRTSLEVHLFSLK